MTSLLRWIFVGPHATTEPPQDDVVRWREFRRFRAVMVRGVIVIVAAQVVLAVWIYRTSETGRTRVATATYKNCVNIEALRKTQRDQLLRSLASYQRPDVQKLLGPKLIALGLRQARERLAELQPINCRARGVPPAPR